MTLLLKAGPDTRRIDHDCADCGAAPIERCQYLIGTDYFCIACARRRISIESPLHYLLKTKGKTACGTGLVGDCKSPEGPAAVEFTPIEDKVTCQHCKQALIERRRYVPTDNVTNSLMGGA